jgi:hypothetical protein
VCSVGKPKPRNSRNNRRRIEDRRKFLLNRLRLPECGEARFHECFLSSEPALYVQYQVLLVSVEKTGFALFSISSNDIKVPILARSFLMCA